MVSGNAKVIGFPGAGNVPTVGQRICPLLSQAVLTPAGQPGQITAQCVGAQCRLWGWCSGEIAEKLIAGIASAAEVLEKSLERRK